MLIYFPLNESCWSIYTTAARRGVARVVRFRCCRFRHAPAPFQLQTQPRKLSSRPWPRSSAPPGQQHLPCPGPRGGAVARPARVTLLASRAPSPPPPLRIQRGPRAASILPRCHKGTDHRQEPEPEPELEPEDAGPNAPGASLESDVLANFCERLDKYRDEFRASLGLASIAASSRVPPDMFRKQKDEILGHMQEIHRKQKDENFGHTREIRRSNPDIPNLMANKISLAVCENAQSALDLASTVMEISTLGIGSTEISQHTTNQMVRMYATISCNAAEEACHQVVQVDTVLSFLGALGSLGAIAHILVQDNIDKPERGPLENKINHHQLDMDYHEFNKKMGLLK